MARPRAELAINNGARGVITRRMCGRGRVRAPYLPLSASHTYNGVAVSLPTGYDLQRIKLWVRRSLVAGTAVEVSPSAAAPREVRRLQP